MKISYTVHGTGKSLVLFHGWGFDSQVWQSIVPRLSDRYRLYLVDLPGFGYSEAMGWDDFKSELSQYLPDCFAVAGWSLGGLFATRLAVEMSNRVTHLVNIASTPSFIRENDWPGVEPQILDTFYQRLVQDAAGVLSQFTELQLKGHDIKINVSAQLPCSTSLQAGLNVLSQWDLRQELLTITQPVCYIFGRLDSITPRALMSTMRTLYPNFHYHMISKASHIPFLSHTDEFVSHMDEFLL